MRNRAAVDKHTMRRTIRVLTKRSRKWLIIGGYNNSIEIEFDEAKNSQNIAERGLSFERAAAFDFERAKVWQDARRDYTEVRIVALGYLDDRLHVLVFSETEHGIRVISFRKANSREGAKHGFTLTCD